MVIMRDVEWIIYGTAWKKEKTSSLVFEAVKNGFRGIDTACQPRHYNEPQVGEALVSLYKENVQRSDIYLQTKFTPPDGQDPDTIPYNPKLPVKEQVRSSFSVSLENLQTEYLDAYILHSPLRTLEATLQAWEAMEEIHLDGGAHRLGISNCYSFEFLTALHQVARVKPAVVQNRFYRETGFDQAIRQWCKENGVVYQAFWTLTANPDILASDILMQLAGKYSKTAPQLFFRFLHQQGITILTGTCDPLHMQQDLAIHEFTLNEDELREINNLLLG